MMGRRLGEKATGHRIISGPRDDSVRGRAIMRLGALPPSNVVILKTLLAGDKPRSILIEGPAGTGKIGNRLGFGT